MGLTERQRQCFIHATGGQIENAVLEHYERARKARTLQGEMYWWTAVFHSNHQRGAWDRTNLSANLVREMLMNERNRNDVKYYDRLDDVVYGVNKDVEHEIRHLEKNQDGETTMIVRNEDPQMHEHQPDELIGFVLMLHDLVEICDELEIRALAYFLYKTELDKFVDYLKHDEFKELCRVIKELHGLVDKAPIDKQKFIGGTRWYSTKAEKSLQEKLRSILP